MILPILLYFFTVEHNFPKRKETESKTPKTTEEEKENIPGKSDNNLLKLFICDYVPYFEYIVEYVSVLITQICVSLITK